MSPLVERVTNSFPQVQRTVASAYSGWMSVFMVPTSVGPWTSSTGDAQRVVLLVGLVDLGARIDDRLERFTRRTAPARKEHVHARAGRPRGHPSAVDRGPPAPES